MFGWKLIKTDGTELLKLALSGNYNPMDFVIAARHVPDYDATKAKHLENQWFNSIGFPMLDPNLTEHLK